MGVKFFFFLLKSIILQKKNQKQWLKLMKMYYLWEEEVCLEEV